MKKFQLIFAFLLVLLISGQRAWTQEVPNGDADTLWRIKAGSGEMYDGFVIHPINSNILLGLDSKIYEYDEVTGNLIREIETMPEIQERKRKSIEMRWMPISSDGQKIFAVIWVYDYDSSRYTVYCKLYDYESGTLIKNIFGEVSYPYFITNTNQLLFLDYSLKIDGITQYKIVKYDLDTDTILDSLVAPYVGLITISEDGSIFAVATVISTNPGAKCTVSIYNTQTFKLIKKLPYTWYSMECLRFSPKNNYISVAYDVVKLSTNQRFVYPATGGKGMHYTDDEEVWVASVSFRNPRIYVYKKETLQPIYVFNNNSSVRILHDNSLIVYGSSFLTKYSNKWYLTDVQSEPEATGIIKRIDYINNAINIELHTPMMVDRMIITDIEGRILNDDRGPQPVDNRIKIEMVLPSGNYILKLISQGKEYTNKFVIVR